MGQVAYRDDQEGMGAFAFTSAALRRDVRTWPGIALAAPAWALYTAAAAVVGVTYFSVGSNSVPQAVIYQGLSLGAIAAIVVGLVRYKPERRLAWLLFAGGLVLWTLGDGYWDAYSWFLHAEAPFPSVADVAYLGGYPFLLGATFVLALPFLLRWQTSRLAFWFPAPPVPGTKSAPRLNAPRKWDALLWAFLYMALWTLLLGVQT